jgi:hypothetical protein
VKPCDKNIQKTLQLVNAMINLADKSYIERAVTGCGILRDSAYKLKKSSWLRIYDLPYFAYVSDICFSAKEKFVFTLASFMKGEKNGRKISSLQM